jgi:hypothetical protein
MSTKKVITLDTAVCPACAVAIPKQNKGCPHCHYECTANKHGRIGTLRQLLSATGKLNDVSPAFLRVLTQIAPA